MRKILSLGVVLFLVSLLYAQSPLLMNVNSSQLESGAKYTKYGDVRVKPQPNNRSMTRSMVLYEDFTSTTFPPSGWTKIDGEQSSGAMHWNRATNLSLGSQETTIEGPVAFVNYCNSSTTDVAQQDEWLITPQITVPADAFLRFDIYTLMRYMVEGAGSESGDGNNGDFNVKISTDDGTTWTTIWNEDTCYNTVGLANQDWNSISVSLAEYSGQSVKIAFQYTGYDACWLVLDNVVVDTLIAQDFELTDARVNFNSPYVNYGYNGNFSHFPRREITSDSKVSFEGVATNYGTEAATVNLVAKVYNPNEEEIFTYTFASVTVPAASYVNGVYQPSVDTIVYYTESGTGSYTLISASLFSMTNMSIDGTYRFEVSLQPASGTYSNQNGRNLSVNRYSTVSDDCLYSRDNANFTQGSYYEACNPSWHSFVAFATSYQIFSTSDEINSVEAYISGATNGATFHYEIFNVNDDNTYTSVFTTESYTINSSTFHPGFIKLFSENPLTYTNMTLDSQEIIVAVVVENNKRVRVGIDETVQSGTYENKAYDGTDWYYISGTNGILMIRTYVCSQGAYITAASANPEHGTATGSGRYELGATATLTAVPNEGYRFLSWSDGSTENPYNITVEGDATYTATFEAIPRYTITAIANNAAYGEVTGSGEYYEGTVVVVEAIPSAGYRFISWDDNSVENPRQITVTEDVILVATFDLPTMYNITVASNNPNFGSVSGGGRFEEGSVIEISATANDGYMFVTWNDNVTDNPRQIVVTSDAVYVANFSVQTYTITAISSNDAYGTVTGGGTFEVGSVITITAVPNENYEFDSWSDYNTDNPREIVVTADAIYIANFSVVNNIENVSANEISIFPNPASDMLKIACGEEISAVEFVSMIGQVVSRIDIHGNEVECNVENLPMGMYFVRIYGKDSLIGAYKFVKE